MSTTLQLLERYKGFHQLRSDYAAAKRLGIRQNTISKWKAGGTMEDSTALLIAQDIGADPIATLAQIAMDRPLTARDRKIWSRYCARVCMAAVATLAAAAPVTHSEARATAGTISLSIHYAHRKRRQAPEFTRVAA